MKKILFLLILTLGLWSCTGNEPKQMQQVTFNVAGMQVETTQMNAPRRAPILDDENGTALTDLYLFDGMNQLVHQTNNDPGFGTIEVQLELGQHDLHFVATRSTGIVYNAGTMSFGSVRPTFGKHLNMNITGSSVNESVELTRITGQLIITIEDAIPNDLDSMTIELNKKYDAFNVTTFNGVNGKAYRVNVNMVNSRGTSGKSFTFNTISETFGSSYVTNLTITSYKHDGSKYIRVIENVPIATNTKTNLSGELYKGATSNITINVEWNEDINGNM